MRSLSNVLLIGFGLAFAGPALSIGTAVFDLQWGSSGTGNGEFISPWDVATDAAGTSIYVVDAANNRIQKFDESGAHLLSWGTSGSNDGQFNFPTSAAVDATGDVYVADLNNQRIQKFSSNGAYITQWGGPGTLDGEFSAPYDVKVDPNGDVWVADYGNGRVQAFDSSGAHLLSLATGGNPIGVAISSVGDIYVTDQADHTVRRYDPSGTFLSSWGGNGTGPGQLSYPWGIALDSNDNVYVADVNNTRVQVFTSVGGFQRIFVGGHMRGIELDGMDRLYLTDVSYQYVQRWVQEPAASEDPLDYLGRWGASGSNPGQFSLPRGVAVDANSGDVWVADTSNDRIQRFGSNGQHILTIGEFGFCNGCFDDPAGVAVDASGNVYAVDQLNARVQKFAPNGDFLQTFTGGAGGFNVPNGIAFGPAGNIYVVDSNNNRIQKFDSGGGFLFAWGNTGTGPGEFGSPLGIDVDASGNVYVGDCDNDRVQKFDSNGVFLTEWGSFGYTNGLMDCPSGIAVDAAGDVFVADQLNGRIQKFDSDGTFLTIWGTGGTGNGEFDFPDGIAIGPEGNLFVTDRNNARIQKFGRVPASITSIVDIGNDQGRQVGIKFQRSGFDFDFGLNPITQYEAFRRIDPLPSQANAMQQPAMHAQGRMLSNSQILTEGWEFVGSIPAHSETEYNMIAATLADSTVEHGLHESVFFVRAATTFPATYFDSPPAGGYSLDNLAPMAPTTLATELSGDGVELSWDEVEDIDLAHYSIYRDLSSGFTPNESNRLGYSVDPMLTDFDVEEGVTYFYLTTATDFAGNEGFASNEANATPTTSSTDPLPTAFELLANRPNPFYPTTELRFLLPRAAAAMLTIYDAAGRSVRSYTWEGLPAGYHSVHWHGRDDTGRSLASGVYLYRFEAGDFEATRRMTLVK